MYCELSDTVVQHPKTCRAARLLGLSRPAVIGHLASLWIWATRYAQDGDISRFDPADIAEASGYEGDPQQFLDALIQCGPGGSSGYVDQDADGRRIHDWMEHTGRTLANRVADAERKRQTRRHTSAGTAGEAHGGRPAPAPEPVEDPVPEPVECPAPARPQRSRKPAQPFTPPTPNEVAEHMLAINAGRFDKPRLRRERDLFMAHFASTGWASGGAKLRDWRSAVAKWLIRAENDTVRPPVAVPGSYDASADHFRELLEGPGDE